MIVSYGTTNKDVIDTNKSNAIQMITKTLKTMTTKKFETYPSIYLQHSEDFYKQRPKITAERTKRGMETLATFPLLSVDLLGLGATVVAVVVIVSPPVVPVPDADVVEVVVVVITTTPGGGGCVAPVEIVVTVVGDSGSGCREESNDIIHVFPCPFTPGLHSATYPSHSFPVQLSSRKPDASNGKIVELT